MILILTVGYKDDISEQVVYIVSSLLISICITISIFAKFADPAYPSSPSGQDH
jgi:hypothetical protein